MWRSIFVLLVIGLPISAGTVPLQVDAVLPDYRAVTPVRFGVPFPVGALPVDGRAVVVDAKGEPLAHQQTRVTATWDPSGAKGTRWLLVDFRASVDGVYRLAFGDDAPAATQAQNIASDDGDNIVINTGPLQVTIPTNCFDLFGHMQSMGAPLVPADAAGFAGPYVIHETKGVFRADLDRTAKVVLEENGPVRAVVKADGWYRNESGEGFCRYTIRAHFFYDQTQVKLDHTFIFTGTSKDDRIRGIGVQIPQAGGRRGFVATDGIDVPHWIETYEPDRFILDAVDHERFEFLHVVGDKATRVGDRPSGWFAYCDVAGAIRDAWQQYPFGFSFNEGIARVELWPEGGRLLDLSWDGIWWFLNEHQKRFLLATKPRRPEDMDAWVKTHREELNATGAAKTHEIWLSFQGLRRRLYPEAHLAGINLAREVAEPLIVRPDPAWSTSTLAMDLSPHVPRDDEHFGSEERYLDAILDMVNKVTEDNKWYGWFDWGGYHQFAGTPNDWSYADAHGLSTWHRARPKSHYGWGQLPWVQYFRTGDRKWLRYAQTYTLYSADRAHVHHTDHGRKAGEEYHYDHSETHFFGGWQGRPSGPQNASHLQQKDDYVYMYWMTGERRALDVLEMWADQMFSNPGALKQYAYKPGLTSSNEIRISGQQLHRLMMLYQATWDERYMTLARSIADALKPLKTAADVLDAETSHSNASPFFTAAGWAYEGHWLYYKLSGDEAFKPTMLAFIDRARREDAGFNRGYGTVRGYTNGYILTGDERYLDLMRMMTDYFVGHWASRYAWMPSSHKFSTINLPRAIAQMSGASDAWRKKNLPLDQRGRTMMFRYANWSGSPVYAGTRVFFNDVQDKAWEFDLAMSQGGQWTMLAPDGAVVLQTPMYEGVNEDRTVTLKVPSDGKTGTYTLYCSAISELTKNNRNVESQAWARVIRCELPMVSEFVQPSQKASLVVSPVLARAYFIQQPAGKAVTIRLRPKDVGRVYRLETPSGEVLDTTAGKWPLATGDLVLAAPAVDAPRLLKIDLDAPADWFMSKPGLWGGAGVNQMVIEGALPYVAANAEQWFEPQSPPGLDN